MASSACVVTCVAVDVGRHAGEQRLQAVDELAGVGERVVPRQAHARRDRAARRGADAEREAAAQRALRRARQLGEPDRVPAVQRHHRRADLGEAGRLGRRRGEARRSGRRRWRGRSTGCRTRRRPRSGRHLAHLVDRRQGDAAGEPPPHPEALTSHPPCSHRHPDPSEPSVAIGPFGPDRTDSTADRGERPAAQLPPSWRRSRMR